ncbi:MAG: serine/threonine protein kinase [Deltaproteobacteria bacterium]|nr:serine/threonine protein kinase [Deltaproteobacteria bacterium]
MERAAPEERFGRYTLVRRLAFGGMAEIFLAKLRLEAGFEKDVVLKRILPQFGADPAFVAMFVDEARLAARLSHPNIVQVSDFGAEDGVYFLAMEYVDGLDLREILKDRHDRQQRLSPAVAAAIGEGVARGLAYAHDLGDADGRPLGIVHRDVSPHNIMVSRTGDAKIMDFGIAKAAGRATRTATGLIKGKVAYMAPEQAAGRDIDHRADQFALGLVIWECLSGQRMFQGGSDLEVLRAVVECRVRPVTELCPEVPDALAQILSRTLAPTPEQRYPHLADLARELATFRFALGAGGAVHLGDLVTGGAPRAEVRRKRATLPLGAAASAPAAEAPEVPTLATRASDAAETTVVTPEPRIASRSPPRPTLQRSGARMRWGLAFLSVASSVAVGGLASRVRDRRHALERPAGEVRPIPEVAAGSVRVTSIPAGAMLFLDGLATGLTTPVTLPRLPLGGRWPVRLDLFGHLSWHGEVTVTPGDSLVAATLSPLGPPAAPPPDTAPTAAPAKPSAAGRHEGGGRPGDREPGKRRGVGEARLWLRSTGAWFDVFLDDTKLGTTPLSGVAVPAGHLELRLVNAEAGLERRLVLDLARGEEARRTYTP